jgi:hypothetical protein
VEIPCTVPIVSALCNTRFILAYKHPRDHILLLRETVDFPHHGISATYEKCPIRGTTLFSDDRYEGCWTYGDGSPAMTSVKTSWGEESIEGCIRACFQHNTTFTYAGLKVFDTLHIYHTYDKKCLLTFFLRLQHTPQAFQFCLFSHFILLENNV